MRIVVVDDEPSICRLVSNMLVPLKHDVTEAQSAQAALERIEALPDGVDLLITDVVMPEMDGFSLTEKVQSIWPRTKVLIISGKCDIGRLRDLLNQQTAFLPKPFTRDGLLKAVEQLSGADGTRSVKVRYRAGRTLFVFPPVSYPHLLGLQRRGSRCTSRRHSLSADLAELYRRMCVSYRRSEFIAGSKGAELYARI